MYEDDDKTDGSSAHSRNTRCLARAAASVLGGSDGAGESVGGLAQAERLREKRAERRARAKPWSAVTCHSCPPRDLSRQRVVATATADRGRGATSRLSDGWNKFQHSTARCAYQIDAACGELRFSSGSAVRTIVLLFALALLSVPAFAGVESPQFDPADGPPFVVVFLMLLGFALALFIAGLGFGFAIFSAGCAALLVAVGIVSSSVMIGVLRGRVSAGVRAFHYLLCAAIAAPPTVGVVLLARTIIPIKLSTAQLCIFGSISGILGGLILAGFLDIFVRIVRRRIFRPTSTH